MKNSVELKRAIPWWAIPDSLMAQTVKSLPAMKKTWGRSLGREDPLEKEMATHFSILAWKVPCMEEPDRLQSMGSQRVRHKWVTWLSFFKEGHENWIEVSRCEVIDANWDFASGKWFYQNLTKDGLAFRDVGSWKAVELFQKWLSTLTAY